MQPSQIIREENYFTMEGEPCRHKYAETFPVEWALNKIKGTGWDCLNCEMFATHNGVLIGYCLNCSHNAYSGERGCGFSEWLIERESLEFPQATKAFDTYLSGISVEDIGLLKFMDSESHHQCCKMDSFTRDKFESVRGRQEFLFEKLKKEINELRIEENCEDVDMEWETFEAITNYYDDAEDNHDGEYYREVYGYGSNYNGGYDSY